MAKKLLKLTEGDLHKIIKESVRKMLKEDYDIFEYEDLIENLNECYDAYEQAITDLCSWYFNNIETNASSSYNSYSGKYGDEAKYYLKKSYNQLGNMLKVDEDNEIDDNDEFNFNEIDDDVVL